MDNDLLQKKLGEAARRAREELGLTQADVAARADMSAQVYGRIERGGMMPAVPTLRRMAVALGTSPAELLVMSPEDMTLSGGDVAPELPKALGLMRKWPAAKLKLALGMLRLLDAAPMREE